MTQPSTVTNNSVTPRPLPPDPRPAAVDFALRLAVIRGSAGPKGSTDVSLLMSDSEAILAFLKKGSVS